MAEMEQHWLAEHNRRIEQTQKEEIVRHMIISLFNRSWKTIGKDIKKGIRSKSMAQADIDDLVFQQPPFENQADLMLPG